MPLVYLLRRFQILKVDLDIHQGSIRRNETTASTKEIIDQDDDVSTRRLLVELLISVEHIKVMTQVYQAFSIMMDGFSAEKPQKLIHSKAVPFLFKCHKTRTNYAIKVVIGWCDRFRFEIIRQKVYFRNKLFSFFFMKLLKSFSVELFINQCVFLPSSTLQHILVPILIVLVFCLPDSV